LAAKYQRRKNIGIAKITVSTKYCCRQNSGIAKISVLTKYRWKLRWRVMKSVEIKVARYQIGGNLGGALSIWWNLRWRVITLVEI
jgi:hypothetical protein